MICHLDAYDDDDYDVRDHEIECFDIKGRRLVTTKASEAQNPSLVARPCPNRVLLLITNVDVDIGTFCGDYIMFTFGDIILKIEGKCSILFQASICFNLCLTSKRQNIKVGSCSSLIFPVFNIKFIFYFK